MQQPPTTAPLSNPADRRPPTAPPFQGYEPFLDHLVNPAQVVALSLNGTCDTVYLKHPRTMRLCYEGVSVPVTAEGSGWAARELEKDPRRWNGIIHLVRGVHAILQ